MTKIIINTKKTSIKKKILIPFISITVFFAILSLLFSIHFISKINEERAVNELEKQNLFFKESLYERLMSSKFYIQMIRDLKKSTLAISQKDNYDEIKNISINLMDKDNISVYWNLNDIGRAKQKTYSRLIEAAVSGKTRRAIYIYPENDKLRAVIAAASAVKINNIYSPVLTELPIDDDLVTDIERNHEYDAGCIFYGRLKNKRYLNLIAATKFISENPVLKSQLLSLITKNNGSEKFIKSFVFENRKYKVIFEKAKFHKKIYTLILLPFNENRLATLRIVFGTIIVLSLICMWIFIFYSLIIHKITFSINLLKEATQKVEAGELDQKIELNTRDEIEELAFIFNSMVNSLKEAKQNRADKTSHLYDIISSIPEAVLVTDNHNNLIIANRLAEQMFRFSSNNSRAKHLLKYIDKEDFYKSLKNEAEKAKPVIVREIDSFDKDKKEKKLRLTICSGLIKNKKSENKGVISIIRNTNLTNKSKKPDKKFFKALSQELNTPLRTITGFVEHIYDNEKNEFTEEQNKYLDIIRKEASDLKYIADNLSDISKIQADKMKITINTVNVYDLINRLIVSYTPVARVKNLKLNTEFKDRKADILADKSKVQNILEHLIKNAVKFTSRGSITLVYRETAEDYVFSVVDTGKGLEKEKAEELSSNFNRMDYKKDKKYKPDATGLKAVKNFVEMHKGRIWFESQPGEGSVFSFSIPKKIHL
ncbi:MAG: HAMP domain-containing protein [bacterium]|nr:HAMP domain-containing protein [bacterium]